MRTLRAVLLSAAIAASALPLRAELVNGIKAIVHDSVITYEEVEVMIPDVLFRQYRNQPEVFRKKLEDSRNENLEVLVERKLILHDFKTAGYNLPESVIDDEVQARIHTDYGDRVKLTKTLQAEGITFEKFREQLRERFIVAALRNKNVSSEIIISPHKVEAYYQAHQNDFKMEDEVKLRMIVLTNGPKARVMADEILTRLKDGASFTEMASVYSQGSQPGGDWGWVERPVLRKELADIAFSLKAGEHSGVIQPDERACYIMQVEDKRVAHVKPIAEVRDQIEKNLLVEERSRLEKQWIERLKKKTFVRYF